MTLQILPLLPILSQSCQISFEPLEKSQLYLELFELSQKKPKEALAKIGIPSSPEIANLKAYIYLKAKKLRKAEAAIKNAYRGFPFYLPAMVNYADLCLRHKKREEIPHIFPNFDLASLFPDRRLFHFSEFRGFMTAMGFYHLAISDRTKAELYYVLATKADPLHPSVEALEKKIFRRSFFSLLKSRFHL